MDAKDRLPFPLAFATNFGKGDSQMKIKRVVIIPLVVLLQTYVGCETKHNRVPRRKQTEADRQKIRAAMADLEQAHPQYVKEARAQQTPL